MEIANKVVIVTGASFGIGMATARLLAAQGAQVGLVARSADRLKELSEELPDSYPVPADFRNLGDIRTMVDAMYKHYGRIDVLINNAGQGMYVPTEGVDIDQYRSMFELNVIGPLVAMQAVIPLMRQQGGGLILNVSSAVSKMYLPGLGAYASTKYALNALSLTARAELESENIRVGIVLPGITTTDFGKNALGSRPADPPRSTQQSTGRPTPQSETAEQVAKKVLEALQSEEAEVFANNVSFLKTGRM